MRFKVMLPENYVVIEAETEAEAVESALKHFKEDMTADDLIAWEDQDTERRAQQKDQ